MAPSFALLKQTQTHISRLVFDWIHASFSHTHMCLYIYIYVYLTSSRHLIIIFGHSSCRHLQNKQIPSKNPKQTIIITAEVAVCEYICDFYFSLQQQQQNTRKKNRPHKFYYTLRHITRRAEVSENANIHIYRRRICVYLILTFERHSLEKRSDFVGTLRWVGKLWWKKKRLDRHTRIYLYQFQHTII